MAAKIDPLISCSQGPEIGKKSGDYGRSFGSAHAQKRAPFAHLGFVARFLPSL